MSDNSSDDHTIYPSDGVETWDELLQASTGFLSTERKTLLAQKDRNFRLSADNQDQLDFFHSPMLDIPHKDDYGLMDINPFGLGKKPRFSPIVYDLSDATITVIGSTEYGIATIYDYDIVIYMISHLARQMNDVKYKVEKGEINPRLPGRRMHVLTSDLFKQLKVTDGGKQLETLLAKLKRLKGTNIEITAKKNDHRRDGSFSLIGDYIIDSETKTGKLSEFYIDIPSWVYDGVVRVTNPTILTLCDDYMSLKSGYHKFLARIAKKSAGQNCWDWTIEELHQRSGSNQPLKNFKLDMKKAINKLQQDPLPEYHINYIETGKGRRSKMSVQIKNRVLPT
jgi:plasmid replication initiation protein